MKHIFAYKIKTDEEINILKQYKDIVDESLIVSKTDINGNITYVNDEFEKISGFSKKELIGNKHNIVRHPDMKDETFKELWETILNKKTWKGIIKNRKKNGESYYVKSTIKPILDKDGNIKEFIAIRKDITRFIKAENLIKDKLQLLNKALLIAVMIDNFNNLKLVYDEEIISKLYLRLLKRTKTLLKEKLDISNTSIEEYNIRDDVFGFLIDKFEEKSIHKIIEEVVNEVNDLPLIIKGFEYYPFIRISYSYGKEYLYENTLNGLEEIRDKEERIFFANDLYKKKKIEILKNMETLKMIEYALHNNKVISVFQPIIDNKSKKVTKYESLVRIIDQQNNIISPFYFLSTAKQAGLYDKITMQVLENTFDVMYSKKIAVSINLSPSDILRKSIRKKIFSLLRDTNPDNGMVTFELLEDEIIKYPKTIQSFVNAVLKLNANIAIDDFGNGYSNFTRIVDVKADIIKIDGEIIKNIHKDRVKQDIVETIVNFAKKEKKEVVAEFVENEEIYKILLNLDVDYSQGYYFSKPLLPSEI